MKGMEGSVVKPTTNKVYQSISRIILYESIKKSLLMLIVYQQ